MSADSHPTQSSTLDAVLLATVYGGFMPALFRQPILSWHHLCPSHLQPRAHSGAEFFTEIAHGLADVGLLHLVNAPHVASVLANAASVGLTQFLQFLIGGSNLCQQLLFGCLYGSEKRVITFSIYKCTFRSYLVFHVLLCQRALPPTALSHLFLCLNGGYSPL